VGSSRRPNWPPLQEQRATATARQSNQDATSTAGNRVHGECHQECRRLRASNRSNSRLSGRHAAQDGTSFGCALRGPGACVNRNDQCQKPRRLTSFPRASVAHWSWCMGWRASLQRGSGSCRARLQSGCEAAERRPRLTCSSALQPQSTACASRTKPGSLGFLTTKSRALRARDCSPEATVRDAQFATKIASISALTLSSVCLRAIAISLTMRDRAVSSILRSPKLNCLSVFRRYKSRKTSATS
jgi:hypothetical protein